MDFLRFGKIWVFFRNKSTLTVQDYERNLRSVFQNTVTKDGTKMKFDVVDIFAVPDYHAWLTGCIDKDLSKYTHTQLCSDVSSSHFLCQLLQRGGDPTAMDF